MAEENETFIEDDSIVLDDIKEDVSEDSQTENIIPFILERFHRAEDYRKQDEERWLRSYRNYRGIYGPDVQFTEAEKSRVFIKVTKTKNTALHCTVLYRNALHCTSLSHVFIVKRSRSVAEGQSSL